MNIILIVSDTFRRDHLGCYGNSWISTPNLDKLARDSVVFDRAYAASFPTVPNRYDLLTGRYTYTYGCWQPLPEDEVVLPEILREAGYVTMHIADTPHHLEEGFHFDRGFDGWIWIRGQEHERYMTDHFDVELPCSPEKLRNPEGVKKYLHNTRGRRYESDYFVAQTMTEAIRWLEHNYRHEKFFLYVDTFDPHEPWDPPRWYVDRYDPGYRGEEVIYPRYAPADYLSPEELKHMRALYAGEVTMVDRWVGMLLQKIEDMGLFDNTAVIFTTDHGFYHGEHGLTGKSLITDEFKGYAPLYEEVAHIPLLIRIPRAQHFRCGELVQAPDLMPTMLELGGAKDPGTMDGKSLMPLLKGEKLNLREFAVTSPSIIHGTVGGLRTTITTKEWSFIYAGLGEIQDEKETKDVDGIAMKLRALGQSFGHELYHLPSDPGQERNLFPEKKDIAEGLRVRYTEFLESLRTKEQYLKYWRDL